MEIESEYGPAFTIMTANLEPGEKIKVEPGAMVAQSEGLEMKTGMGSGGGLGGFMKSMIKRAVGGEAFFVNTYTAGPSGGWISLAPSSPGDIETFDLDPGQSFYMQGGAFMASTINVDTTTKFQGAKSLFSREGAFFLRAVAADVPGSVFFTSYGAMKEIEVTPDKPIKIDNGHVVASPRDSITKSPRSRDWVRSFSVERASHWTSMVPAQAGFRLGTSNHWRTS